MPAGEGGAPSLICIVILTEVPLICPRAFGEERAGRKPEAEETFLSLKLRFGIERCIFTSLLFHGIA
jgi:hypothetical protein